MLAVGSMSKGKFVEDSKIKIYYVPGAYQYKVKKSHDVIYLKHKKVKFPLSKFRVFADCIYYKGYGEDRFRGLLRFNSSFCYGTFRIYNSLKAKSFVHNSKDPSGMFRYDILSIESMNAKLDNCLVSATKTGDGYFMQVKYENNGYEAKDTTLVSVEGILPMEDFDVKAFDNSLIFLLNKLKRAKIIFRNKDEFDGTVKIKAGNYGTLNYELLNGTYKYHSTGDVFVGDYQRIYYDQNGIHVPTNGIMKLANGEQFRGDSWLTQYPDVREFGRFFEDGDGPSKICRLAQERQQELNEWKAKERAKELRRQQRQREIQARRQYLINEYGYKYGRLLADDKVCLGMTKEMVSQIRDESNYSITKYDLFGDLVETWTCRSLFAKGSSYTFENGILTSYTE